MISTPHFKKGDILIDSGKAYKVFDVKNRKNYDGKTEPFVIYKPCLKDWPDKSLICSIPVSSLVDSNIRKPLKKHEVADLLNLLDDKPVENDYRDNIKADEVLQSNDPFKIIKLLIKSWISKENPKYKSKKTNRGVYIEAVAMISREIAIVYDISEEKAEEMLLSKLG